MQQDLIGRVPLFASLPRSEIEYLAGTLPPRQFAAGAHHPDIIFLDYLTSHEDSHASISIISRDEILQKIPLFILAPESIMAKVDKNMPNLEKFITKPVNYGFVLDLLQRILQLKKE